MPAYKDAKTGKWYCKFYYTDWTGSQKQKKKSGFALKREALEWERKFLKEQSTNPDIPFSTLADAFIRAKTSEWKVHTQKGAQTIVEYHLKPYFGRKPINEISPLDVKQWHMSLQKKGIKQTSINTYHGKLSAIFNYGVKFYGLPTNPARIAGSVKERRSEMKFWTVDQFKKFLDNGQLKEKYYVLFNILFWTGTRIGEVLALTPRDICDGYININKNVVFADKKAIIQSPKSDNGYRRVAIHKELHDMIWSYIKKLHGVGMDDRIFWHTTLSGTRRAFYIAQDNASIERIRVHDLRHSHVALLIHMGYHTKAIADRIGDTPDTVNNRYSHIYQSDIDKMIDRFSKLSK